MLPTPMKAWVIPCPRSSGSMSSPPSTGTPIMDFPRSELLESSRPTNSHLPALCRMSMTTLACPPAPRPMTFIHNSVPGHGTPHPYNLLTSEHLLCQSHKLIDQQDSTFCVGWSNLLLHASVYPK